MKTFDVYPLYPINIVSAKGSYLYDQQGTEYLDFYGGHAVISVGHSHTVYVDAIKNQIEKIGFFSNSVLNHLQRDYAELLGKTIGYDDYELFLINSGAEANENALKLASFYTKKKKVIAFKKGFHGRTSASVRCTDNSKIIAPINEGFPCSFMALGDLASVEAELKKGDVAAVIIEGIQGIAGIYCPADDFLLGLQRLCERYEAILILDEIQSGFGRSGKFFAHQYVKGLRPDLITIAKGMANGFPIGGVLISPKFKASYGLLGTTFGGNHLAMAAAIATLRIVVEENLVDNAAAVGQYIKDRLRAITEIVEVRGRGLMIGIEFPYPVKALRSRLLNEKHLFVGSAANPNTIRLLPALNITEDQASKAIEILAQTLNEAKT